MPDSVKNRAFELEQAILTKPGKRARVAVWTNRRYEQWESGLAIDLTHVQDVQIDNLQIDNGIPQTGIGICGCWLCEVSNGHDKECVVNQSCGCLDP